MQLEDVSRDLEFCFKMLNLNVYVRCILTAGCILNIREEKSNRWLNTHESALEIELQRCLDLGGV